MEESLKILLCEDDENLGMLLREFLQAKGYQATLCPDGEAGYKEFMKEKFDLCVLDVMMPKKDGFTLAQEIRQAVSDMPIIFLTAKTQKDDILEGFKIGADDYIPKPFSMEELVFRIEAILRRVRGKKSKESTLYHIGRFTFDTQKQLLTIGDQQTKSALIATKCCSATLPCVQSGSTTTISMPALWMFTSPSCVSTSKQMTRLRSSTSTAKDINSSFPMMISIPLLLSRSNHQF